MSDINSATPDEDYQIILKNLQNARDVWGEASTQYVASKRIAQDYLASNKNKPVSESDNFDDIVAILQSLAIGS